MNNCISYKSVQFTHERRGECEGTESRPCTCCHVMCKHEFRYVSTVQAVSSDYLHNKR